MKQSIYSYFVPYRDKQWDIHTTSI